MALIRCPNCRKAISQSLNSCSYCKFPITQEIVSKQLARIVIYGILIILLIAINAPIVLLGIPALIVPVLFLELRKDAEEKNRFNKDKIEYNQILSKTKQETQETVKKFARLYVDSHRNVRIPDEDIKALRRLLESSGIDKRTLDYLDNKFYLINTDANTLFCNSFTEMLVTDEIERQRLHHFEKLLNQSLQTQKTGPLQAQFIRAYVDAFGNDLEHETLMRKYLETRDVNLTTHYLTAEINKEIARRAEERRVNEIRNAMDQRKKLLKTSIKEVDMLSGIEFEKFLAKLFKAMGYKVDQTKMTGDQGADLIVEKLGEKTVVQAKRYSSTVGNSAIQEAVAAKNHYDCTHAIVITNSTFTKSAVELSRSNDVALWDRVVLTEKIKSYL